MSLLIVHVFCRVKPEHVAAFADATRANSAGSLREPGVLRFDVIQERDDPTRFELLEVYRDDAAAVAQESQAHEVCDLVVHEGEIGGEGAGLREQRVEGTERVRRLPAELGRGLAGEPRAETQLECRDAARVE